MHRHSGEPFCLMVCVHKDVCPSQLRCQSVRQVKRRRVRIRSNKGYLTIKGPSIDGGLSRYEWEKEITVKEAEELLHLCNDSRIYKIRYLVRCGNHTYEVDEFYGDNEGLVVAEIELDNENETFDKPDFLGEEVTGQARYYNSHLTRHPYKEW